MTYADLPADARLVDGYIYLPATMSSLQARQLLVRVKGSEAVLPSPAVTNTFTLTKEDLAAGLTLDSAVAGEFIPRHRAIAIVNGLAYCFNATNFAHAYAFSGFSMSQAQKGEKCSLKANGVISLEPEYQLVPDEHYLLGLNGELALEASPGFLFTRIAAYALGETELRILNLQPIFLT